MTTDEIEAPAEDGSNDGPNCTVGLDYGPFFGSVIILHGSGKLVRPHHVWAFNAYLDEVLVMRGVASKAGFKAFWSKYKAEMGKTWSSVESPYKWEKPNVPDILGVYHPDSIMEHLRGRADVVWGYIWHVFNATPSVRTFPSQNWVPA